MLVKVFIKRQIKDGSETEAFALLKELRAVAMKQDGYISGETLVSADDPLQVMVVSTWESREEWLKWLASEDRLVVDQRLAELQEKKTEYEPFVFSKYRLSVQQNFPESRM